MRCMQRRHVRGLPRLMHIDRNYIVAKNSSEHIVLIGIRMYNR